MPGQGHGLGPATHAQLGEDAAHVELDGGDADHEPLGDLGVGKPFGHQGQHLLFPVRESIVGLAASLASGLDQRLGSLRGQGGAAGVGVADGLSQILGGDVLEQIADGPSLQGPLDQVLLLEAG